MIGVIGGSGLYSIEGLEIQRKESIETPFGKPSAPLVFGKFGDRDVVFLPRHGENHELLPSEINYRANIWALKKAGVRQVMSVSAVGSLQQELAPGDIALPTQYVDFTKGIRRHTYFGEGVVAHISTGQPVCPALVKAIENAAEKVGVRCHSGRTYACVEGPRLGSRAESFFFKNAGFDMLGMTNVPEVFLAREAQLCYSTIAVITDYDCWLDDPCQHVTVDKLMALYKETLGRVREVLRTVLASVDPMKRHSHGCQCPRALEGTVMTAEQALPAAKKELLAFLRS